MTRSAFWRGLVMDPVTKDASSSRCIALWFAVVCVPLALLRNCDGVVIGALVGGGVVALLTRKAAPDGVGGPHAE